MPQSRIDKMNAIERPLLRELAQGYSNNELVGENLFPTVKVSKVKGQIPIFGKSAFRLPDQTVRAANAPSNRISKEFYDLDDFRLKERDLEYPIDIQEMEEENDIYKEEEIAAEQTQGKLLLKREKEYADLALESSLYHSDLKIDVSGAGDKFDKDTSTPIDVFRDAVNAVKKFIVKKPNICVIPTLILEQLLMNKQIRDYISDPVTKRLTTIEDLQKLFGITKIVEGGSLYVPNAETNEFDYLWGKSDIVMAYVPELAGGETQDSRRVSYGYTFEHDKYPYVDQYDENGGKTTLIRNTHKYAIKHVAVDDINSSNPKLIAGALIRNCLTL